MPIEVGRFGNLFNGNYVLYGFVGWCFHHLLAGLGVEQLAVTSLQVLDALIGAAGLWLFFRLLRKLGAGLASALLWAAILGTTLGYWRWSTDAEDYIFSTFLLLVNFYALVSHLEKGRPKPELLGALHALAIMGHIVNAVFAPVILWFLFAKHGKSWRKPALRYAAAAAGATIAAYAAALAIARPPDALVWLWGSAARSAEAGGVSFGGGFSVGKLGSWLKMTSHILASSSFGSFSWIARAGLLVLAAAFLRRSREIFRRDRAVAAGACVWLACYALVFTSWQPDTMVYRTTDLPAICLLLFLASRALGRAGLGVSAAVAVALGIGNFKAEIHPRSIAANNPDLVRMSFIREHTGPGDWVTGGGGLDELYLPYFAQRKPLVVDRFRDRPEALLLLIGHETDVFVTSRTLEDPFWRAWFRGQRLTPWASNDSGFRLYRLGPDR